MAEDQDQNIDQLPEELKSDGLKTSGGPLGIVLPPEMDVWRESRRLANDRNVRVEDLAVCASQDPSIVLELLRVANAMYFSGGRPPITTTKAAIQRLGQDIVTDTLEKMKDRPKLEEEDVRHWFEVHRSRCKRTAIIARVISEVSAKTLSDDSQTAGLMMYVGDLVAVAYFRERYVNLAEDMSRSAINYRLVQDFKFDPEQIGLAYLRRHGIPEAVIFALDRESRAKSPERAIMRPICSAAGEMVEAFDANRWEKLAPGKKIPPMSAIRLLQLSDSQYLKLYERVSEFLFAIKMQEEKKKHAKILAPAQSETEQEQEQEQEKLEPKFSRIQEETDSLEADIQNLLKGPIEESTDEQLSEKIEPFKVRSNNPTQILQLGKYDLGKIKDGPSKPARKKKREVEAPPQMRTKGGNALVSSICSATETATSSEELLTEILKILTDNGGPFKRSALIVVSKERDSALVVAARGPNITNGQTLVLDDPLSPLAQCFAKVQSFGSQKSKNSPWGSKAYAVAPLDAEHNTPVALYADCGDDGSISFEARRVFRNVVDILNQKLPQLPGGIPVEVS